MTIWYHPAHMLGVIELFAPLLGVQEQDILDFNFRSLFPNYKEVLIKYE